MRIALCLKPGVHHLKFDGQMADTHFVGLNFGSGQSIFRPSVLQAQREIANEYLPSGEEKTVWVPIM
jgi:hypothetical protein